MSRRILIPGLLLGFLAFVGPVAAGVYSKVRQSRLRAIFKEIEHAERQTAYIGVRKTAMPGPMGSCTTVVKLTVADEDRRRVEFIETRVDGAPQKAESRRLPHPMLKGPFHGGMPAFFRPLHGDKKTKFFDFDLMTRNYAMSVTGERSLCGRTGDVVELRPHVAGRSSYRIVADRGNRFPLAFSVIDAQGREIFSYEFESIDFSPALPQDLLNETSKHDQLPKWVSMTQHEVSLDHLSEEAGFQAFAPGQPPEGFELLGAQLLQVKLDPPKDELAELGLILPKIDTTVLHLTYTDGMAIYTMIEFRADNEFWKQIKAWLPGLKNAGVSVEEKSGAVVARKIKHPAGVALQMELKGTVVIAAGNISAEEIEESLETLVQR